MKENAKNKNTQTSTNNWIKVWKSWASENSHDKHIEEYELEVLKKIVEELYALKGSCNLVFEKFTCDYLFQIALDIVRLPIQMAGNSCRLGRRAFVFFFAEHCVLVKSKYYLVTFEKSVHDFIGPCSTK